MQKNSISATLSGQLSQDAQILEDPATELFKNYLQRWTLVGLQEPAAIILVNTEDDCKTIVSWAWQTKTPFVCKSGGNSPYSTIDKKGIIIDLGGYHGFEHDVKTNRAILKGSIKAKEVGLELSKDGACTTLPQGNPVGAIPFFINGGNSPLISQVGWASDQILSARVITAKGDLVIASEDENPDLFWAIRGAGQYFGLVTQLVVKTYSFSSLLGNSDGLVWSGRFVFPLDRAEEVCNAMKQIVANENYSTGGLIMVFSPPPQRVPALVVSAKMIGNIDQQETAFQQLYLLNPIMAQGKETPIYELGDALGMLFAQGDFKRLLLTGLYELDTEAFKDVIALYQELLKVCPDATPSMFNFQWESQYPKKPASDSALSFHDIRYWQNNLTWHTDPKDREIVDKIQARVVQRVRANQKPEEYVDFPNSSREVPVDQRYKGNGRIERLSTTKHKWDPIGVFSSHFL